MTINYLHYFVARENYVFTCRCMKCEQQINDPDVTSDDNSEMEDDSST